MPYPYDIPSQHFSVTVDWLSFTLTTQQAVRLYENKQGEFPQEIASHFGFRGVAKPSKPIHGYRQVWTIGDPIQAIVMWDGIRSDMGVHIQCTGTGMTSVCARTVIGLAMNAEARISRIDLAIDVTCPSSADEFYDAMCKGWVKSRAKQFARIQSPTGTTAYLGSRLSTRYMRVYDKGKQMNTGTIWTRIELEVKGIEAHTHATVIRNQGYDTIPTLIRRFAECQMLPWYHVATNLTQVNVALPKEVKRTDRRKWIDDFVLPLLEREAISDVSFALYLEEKVSQIVRLALHDK